MKGIEWQVVSLELAKELDKLGVKRESVWYWYSPNGKNLWHINHKKYLEHIGEVKYPSYTVAELGTVLPRLYSSWKNIGRWFCQEISAEENHSGHYEEDEISEANARAKMLIYLLKNKLIKAEDVNG